MTLSLNSCEYKCLIFVILFAVIFMKGIRDITTSQRVCKMSSDDYVKFTLKRSVVSDAGTYCILARNAYGCDRAFVTVVVRITSDSSVKSCTKAKHK